MQIDTTKQKTPRWVWVISIFYFLSAGYTLLSFYLVFSGAITLTVDESQYFNSLTELDYGLSIAIASLNLLAAISLFMLKRAALYLFTATYSVSILVTGWHLLSKGLGQALYSAGIAGAILSWCLMLTVYLYTWKLYRTKVLS